MMFFQKKYLLKIITKKILNFLIIINIFISKIEFKEKKMKKLIIFQKIKMKIFILIK